MGILSDSVLIFMGINIILAISLYITLSTGQISLGHGAFMGIGAYSASVLTVKFGVPLVPALLAASVIAAIIGACVAFPALRVRGIYFAVATLGMGEVVRVFFDSFSYTGGLEGFSGMKGTTVELVYGIVVLALGLTWILSRSRLGWAFKAIHDDEIAAQTMGLNITYLKVLAFAISAGMAGIGGALYAHFLFFINPESFGFHTSLLILFFVIFGGIETFWGAALGAAILTLLPEYFRGLQEWRMVVYGFLIIIMMVLRPQGIISQQTINVCKKSFGRLIRSFRKSDKDNSVIGITRKIDSGTLSPGTQTNGVKEVADANN